MEFVDLSRYLPVKGEEILPFSELRKMKPVWLTSDLQIVDEPENMTYAKYLAEKGIAVTAIRKRPPFSKYIDRTSFPRRILFEMTSRCNFECRMCPQQNLKRPRMDMPGELYRKVVDEIDKYGVEGLWLYHLGESLLHPEFRDNLKHISTKKNLGVIWMSTNGQYFNEDNIRCVLASNIDYINFSAHAVTKETYKTVASQGDFDVVQGNLENFYSIKGTDNLPRKPYLHCQMIEQETTKHEIDAFIAKHYKRAEVVSINMLEYVNLPNNAYGLKQRERKPLTSCMRISRNDCFICSNGHVTLCDAAYNGEIFLGDVNKQALYDIWNGQERKKILELNKQGRMREIEICSKCTDYDI
ncbi:MAG: SPASM domain-containing protein [Candidatus Saganbacteria bacterium]|nr:SPASM domain-containing protein [Candidatus Saganbacteria bacterium]